MKQLVRTEAGSGSRAQVLTLENLIYKVSYLVDRNTLERRKFFLYLDTPLGFLPKIEVATNMFCPKYSSPENF